MLYGPEISQYVPCMLQFSDNLWRFFIYYNYIAEIANFTLDLLKNFDYSRNPGPTKKFSKTREASIISRPQLNIIASILELLKILSEVILAFKCGPPTRIEKQVKS